MKNTNEIGSINIQNNDLGYTIISKEYVQVNTSKLKRLIATSNHVKSYMNTPFNSILHLFYTIPEIKELVLPKIYSILNKIDPNYRCISSTFYDKPYDSNSALEFHQDIQIDLKSKLDDSRFNSWVKRDGYYQVIPPIEVLENIITIRIHLDNCKIKNGALKIIPKSHKVGFIDLSDYKIYGEKYIELNEGDILKLSPLLLHASDNNLTSEKRRVIHLSFSSLNLPWYEEFS